MAGNKKRNYTVTKDFEHYEQNLLTGEVEQATFKEGEIFKIPENWEVNEAKTNEFKMRQLNKETPVEATAFSYQKQVGITEEWQGKKRVKAPLYAGRTVILPVK